MMIKFTSMSRLLLIAIIAVAFNFSSYSQTVNVSGETPYRKWHKIAVSLTLPSNVSESSTSFRNNRMDVIFTDPNGNDLRVPGFFAADGNAANSNATTGKIFKAYLRPNVTGNWTYRVLFYTGNNVVLNNVNALPSPIHNIAGSIGNVIATNKSNPDLRAKGRLQYQKTGTNNQRRYLRWAETGGYFLKFGPDSPENLLDYDEFDHDVNKNNCGLCSEHSFNPHAEDWNTGDPTWDSGKGKNLIGAVNYLKNQQMNSMSLSLFGGDDKNVFPWTALGDKFKFDVSKLEQWEIVFDHAQKSGLMLHFKLAEAENWNALTLDQIKVFYREMVARFGHHLAIEWNISEEYGSDNDSNAAQPANVIPRIDWLASIDPWQNHRVLHTYPGRHEKYYNYLIANNAKLTGASVQSSRNQDYDDAYDGKSGIKTWINESKNAGLPWVVASDEQNSGATGMFTSEAIGDSNVKTQARTKILWKGLMAGGAGVMWYGGKEGDFRTENFNRFTTLFEWSKIAILQFFEGNGLEYWKMQNNDALASGNKNRCLAQVGKSYIVYLEDGGSSSLNLSGQSGDFNIKWFNPRTGGGLQNGSITSITGGGNKSIGNPPSNTNSDWVALIRKAGGVTVAVTGVSITPVTVSIQAGQTFSLVRTVTPSNATDKTVSWSTSKPNIATVNSNGLITAIAEGTVTITGTTQDGSFTDSSVITISPAPVVEAGCPFEEENGLLVIEAENAVGYEDALFSLETAAVGSTSPTGTGYLRYVGPNHLGAQVAAHTIAYKVKINNPGVYRILWRNVRDPKAATADAANDSWFFAKDNGARFYGMKGSTEYTLTKHTKMWIQKSEFDFIANGETHAGGAKVNGMSMWVDFPAAGEYTLEYGGRSKGHSVDRIVLFKANQQIAAKNISTPESAQEANCSPTIPDPDPNPNCANINLDAIDFPTTQVSGFVNSYIDNTRKAMAINAAQHKDVFAAVKQNFTGVDGTYDISITTLAELDGESTYRVRVGGVLVGSYQNPTTTVDYTPTTKTWTNVSVNNGDEIQVEFNSHTNGTVPEGGSTAFSRGRWTALSFACSDDTSPIPGVESIAFSALPVSFNSSTTTLPIDITYTTNQQRDINVTLKSPINAHISEHTVTVNAGSNQTVRVNITLASGLAIGDDYKFVAALRTVAGDFSTNIDKKVGLVDVKGTTDSDAISLLNAPTLVNSDTSYSIPVEYTASDTREIVIALYKGNLWQKSAKATVTPGSGTEVLTINLDNATVADDDYSWRAHIRPVGTAGNESTANTRVNFTVTTVIDVTQTPFGGTARQIPGVVQAEDYDEGGQGIAYNDVDATNNGGVYRTDGVDIQSNNDPKGGAYNVGWIAAGEWLEYTVNVTTTQRYVFYPRVASNTGNGQFNIQVDGTDVSGTLNVPNTGSFQTYENLAVKNVNLTAGIHVVRIEIITGGMNFSRWTAWGNPLAPINFSVNKKNIETTDLGFSVYPNPMGNNDLVIKLEGINNPIYYSVSDINGRLIKTGTSNRNNFTISSNVIKSKGIYILTVQTDGQQFRRKIVK